MQDNGPLQASTHEYVNGLNFTSPFYFLHGVLWTTAICNRRCVAYTINMYQRRFQPTYRV